MAKFHQSIYRPKFPEKYKGNVMNIVCRSSWERAACNYFDNASHILEWSSEETIIPYMSPLDNRTHRYFIDFKIKVRDKAGNIRTILVEVKPSSQTVPPKTQKRVTRRYLTEVQTWGVNSAKWDAARKYCKQRGWEFFICTEKHLFGNGK